MSGCRLLDTQWQDGGPGRLAWRDAWGREEVMADRDIPCSTCRPINVICDVAVLTGCLCHVNPSPGKDGAFQAGQSCFQKRGGV
ncbi:hypothetical protein NHX12_021195 [Muraenolepis orangiensis]|uniref:Uncharacterized protein n=1 Tax=Muraenolepis orangiensis TaxID=630683 RepID=A0A9Q0EQ04_9TELE|nr:hypothetical protein NHX12_021195 [Muraenolepis orangiensis]